MDPVELLPFLGIIPLVLVPIMFFKAIRERDKRNPIEVRLSPVYEEKGGGRFNGFNWTMPFVRISIYDKLMVIRWLQQEIVLKPEDIAKVSIHKHVFSKGIRIFHTQTGAPETLILWTADPGRVLMLLKDNLQARVD